MKICVCIYTHFGGKKKENSVDSFNHPANSLRALYRFYIVKKPAVFAEESQIHQFQQLQGKPLHRQYIFWKMNLFENHGLPQCFSGNINRSSS